MSRLTISSKNPNEAVTQTAVQAVQFKPISFQTPVKSRFFQGQFLTDRDLDQLQTWTNQRLLLNRLRNGWGTVTGLSVTADPEKRGHIVVTPGLATDSGGRDIVVNEPIHVDLSAVFSLKDPCERSPSKKDETAQPEPTVKGVHIFLHYHEKDMIPQTVLGSGSCNEAARCEYSRTQETFTISWQRDEGGTDPWHTAVLKWSEAYQACLNCINEFPFTAVNANNKSAIMQWLRQWLKKQPVTHFNFINRLVATLPSRKLDAPIVLRLLFWMTLDYRLQFLATPMSSSQPEDGVLLGRVWLEEAKEDEQQVAVVTAVENEAPQRRPLMLDQWPAPLGLLNGAQLIWQHIAGIGPTLNSWGVEFVKPEQLKMDFGTNVATGVNNLRDLFKLSPFLNPETTVAPIYFDGTAFGFGHRLIGFKNSQALLEPVASGQWQTPDWIAELYRDPPKPTEGKKPTPPKKPAKKRGASTNKGADK